MVRSTFLATVLLAPMCAVLPAAALVAQEPQATTEAEHAEGDHAAGHDAAHGSPQPLTVDPDLAFWTLIVFVALLAVLRKFAWGPIIVALDNREQTVADHLAAAETAQADAVKLLAEYERKLADAANEVRAILDEARRDAAHTSQEILAHARRDAEAEMSRAKREVEIAKDQALKELAETAANTAVDLAGRIIGQQLKTADHAGLIADAMAKFPKGDFSRN